MDNLTTPPQAHRQGFAYDSLESVRKKLLDLSGRNTLLNYKHPKASCVRLVDCSIADVYKTLHDDKTLTFIPVPEPTEKQLIDAGYSEEDPETKQLVVKGFPTAAQWGKQLNIPTSYDLDDAISSTQSSTRNLQVLMFSSELEAILRKLRSKAESYIEESGANILYLSMGFLEWFESRDSDIARRAPLFTIPVKLDKSVRVGKEGVYRYSIQVKDDGLLTNISLREKLANDFDLVLPEIDEDTTPNDYFHQIEDSILRHQPRWSIKKYASLVLLNFTKQAMYLDLDPENWPEDANIKDHELISRFFSTGGQESAAGTSAYETEHEIDKLEDIHQRFPLVFDADSSQHSAIIDAVNGENLVIEGPPGSGKSQTITNIIAGCLGNGQNVLFVAEKMAALEVVKSRLDRAGLGDFCLELHSHKANKQKILGDLATRLNNAGKYRKPKEIEADVSRFEDLKTKLTDYSDLINSVWGNTGLTLHEILHRATRYRQTLHISPERLSVEGINGETFTAVRQRELADQAKMLSDAYDLVSEQTTDGNINSHHWYGVNNTALHGYQVNDLNNQLTSWTDALKALHDEWLEYSKEYDLKGETGESLSITAIGETISKIQELPDLVGGEPLAHLCAFSAHTSDIKQLITDYQAIHDAFTDIAKVIKPDVISNKAGEVIALTRTLDSLKQLGVSDDKSLSDMALSISDITSTLKKVTEVKDHFAHVTPDIDPSLHCCFEDSHRGTKEFLTLIGLINELPADLWRHRDEIYDNPDVDPVLDQITQRLSVLTPLHSQLHESFSLHPLPASDSLKSLQSILSNGGLFKWFSSEWRNARKKVLALSPVAKPDANQLMSLIPALIEYVEGIEQLDKLNSTDPVFNEVYLGIDTPLDRLTALRRWYRTVRNEYGVGFGDRVSIGSALLSMDRQQAMAIKDFAAKGLKDLLEDIQKSVDILTERFASYTPLHQISESLSSSLPPLASQLNALLKALKPIVGGGMASLSLLRDINDKWKRQQDCITSWRKNPSLVLLTKAGISLPVDSGKFSQQPIQIVKNTLKITAVATDSPYILRSIEASNDAERYEALKSRSSNLFDLLNRAQKSQTPFLELGKLTLKEWSESCTDSLRDILLRNQRALDNPQWLNTWLDYIKLRARLSESGLGNIVHELELHTITSDQLQDVLHLVVYHILAEEVMHTNPELTSFSGLEQTGIRRRFREYDRKLMELQQKRIAHKASVSSPPTGVSSGRVKDYTELSLIKHNLGLKRPRIAIRSLFKRAGKSIQSLKPCFLMSPMSVAQYLQPGKFNFDLIIMDEASQIRPEDALGAIARGTSLVVVGDPKQLPPTSFFQKAVSNEDNEDVIALEESESILDSVIPVFRNRRLRWHYRSRHESLIAFSNQNFYDSNLILFPSPFRESGEYGINYKPVQGRFVNRKNVEEARLIVQNVAEQLRHFPEESVGIVAMNAEQSDEIEKQLEQKVKSDPILQQAFEKNQKLEEPLFIKNLENVQGDERDVIVISMTYGPETVGSSSMHQRFGPINSDVGWRRLNVLFTRSKKRMHIFSSMTSGHIRTGTNSSRGVKSLKAFLEYCETGRLQHYQHTGKAADSDFEIAVMDMLAKYGYECEPQLGVAGYFLDIAVKDPGMPGKFLVGIECDGASYHSAKSARDRDRLRQDILENLGWKIRRIWSTDWFDNPEAQIQPILNELDSLKTKPSVAIEHTNVDESVDEIETLIQFTDDLFGEGGSNINDNSDNDLESRLREYDSSVIRVELPETTDSRRLLRPAMVEALLSKFPCSVPEFHERIPAYLRIGTDPAEDKYLEPVLHLIAQYA